MTTPCPLYLHSVSLHRFSLPRTFLDSATHA